jgi:hypothetical protein
MQQHALIGMRNPALAYAQSALAVKLLVSRGGLHKVIDLFDDLGSGTGLNKALEKHFGKNLEALNQELTSEIVSM